MSAKWKVVGVGAGLALAVAVGGCLPWFFTSAPSPPTGLTATDGNFSDRVELEWSPAARADYYIVYRATSQAGPYQKLGETAGITFTDGGVAPNVVYWYRVKACNSAGCSDPSQPDSGYAADYTQLPAPPTGVSATDGTHPDRVVVTWLPVPGASYYEVWRDPFSQGPFTLQGTVTETSFSDQDVIPGQTYWYRIKACNPQGCSGFSAADSGFAEAIVPDTPTRVTASDGTYEDRVRVDWEEVAGASWYEIWRAPAADGEYEELDEDLSPPYFDTQVTVGTTYWYKVRACSPAGCSALSAANSGYAQTGGGGGGGGEEEGPPPIPGGVSATDGEYPDDENPDVYKIRVTWNAVSGADYYQVLRSLAEGDNYQVIEDRTEETEYFDEDDAESPVVPCVEYWYRVRACSDEYGCSDPSLAPDSGYAGTKVEGLPSNVRATDGRYTDRIEITWDEVVGAAVYTIFWSLAPDGSYEVLDQTPGTTFTHTGLAPDTTLWYRIQACSEHPACGCTGLSLPEKGFTRSE